MIKLLPEKEIVIHRSAITLYGLTSRNTFALSWACTCWTVFTKDCTSASFYAILNAEQMHNLSLSNIFVNEWMQYILRKWRRVVSLFKTNYKSLPFFKGVVLAMLCTLTNILCHFQSRLLGNGFSMRCKHSG